MSLAGALHRIYSRETFRVYRYPESGSTEPPVLLPPEYRLEVFEDPAALSADTARVVLEKGPLNIMWWRFRRRLARLLVLRDTAGAVAAYGWIQSWRPFRRRFRPVATSGTMLGFYWTHRAHRGRGLYGCLLRRSIALARGAPPLIIYAERHNESSLRGIVKVGFEFVMDIEIRRFLHLFSTTRVVSTREAP